MEYCNYHKHDHISSIFTPDTHICCEEYVKRAVELGHTTYFTTNHGSGGDIFEAKTICDKYGIRCLFGIEGYIVPNPLEKDKRNYHIIIIPTTNNARKKTNLITSRANIEGFYYKPRIFIEDLLALDKNDVYITTACAAGLLRDDDSYNQIFLPLAKHFKDNMLLEVQTHNIDIQKKINEKCIKLSADLGLKLIAANDSHYVYPEQYKDRIEYLKGKGINYGDEDSFILDYPDRDTMAERFRQQGVLSEQQIQESINNTKLFLSCKDIMLDKEIKMPSIYPNLTPQEKVKELKRHINKKFAQICREENITGDKKKEYVKGIREEMKVIEDTSEINTADYFLFNERNTELAVNKYGGILTRTGRGSCGSFYINRILGMTQLDRFTAPIKLYPERFMSTARLLENKAMPDIDFNVVEQEPFVKASRELLGEHGCYPMIAYGTMKDGEAFRNVCRSHGLSYDEYNEVAKNIENYENDDKWKPYIDEAKKYIGSIVSASVHPCAHLLMNADIREELGIVRVGNALCVMITSAEADEYKYLKNDYLIVSCWKLISETFDMIGKPIMTIKELLDNIDNKVWDLYKNGLTCTLNQCDGDWATRLLTKYQVKNLAETAMFVACIRPSFNSWRDKFINREEYSTGSKALDDVLSSTKSYILFQENLMQYFDWLGITPSESIGLIKKISKKKIHQEDFDKLESRLREQWIKNTGSEDMFNETWAMIQSCISYGFAAPHALAVAIDSLYGAYLKANYPLEYYTVCLNNYADNEEKTKKLTEELSVFNITIKPIKFRHSKDIYAFDKENNAIYKGISSVKFLNADIANVMYNMREQEFSSFIDFLKINPCDSRQTKILIMLDFFSEFGKSQKLFKEYDIFQRFYGRKQLAKKDIDIDENIMLKYAKATKKKYIIFDSDGLMKELCSRIENKPISVKERLNAEFEYLGYMDYINPKAKNYGCVTNIDTKYSPRLTIYQIDTGEYKTFKIPKKDYTLNPISKGDLIKFTFEKRNKACLIDGVWTQKENEFDLWINKYVIVKEN